MERRRRHLPADAVRPAMILFTDGKHDVAGVPASRVRVARDRLFGGRSPFALLPVGMGLDPKRARALEAGSPACASSATCRLRQRRDVRLAAGRLPDGRPGRATRSRSPSRNATCTFTVAPTPTPTPPQAHARRRSGASGSRRRRRGIELTLGRSGRVGRAPIVDYRARCRARAMATGSSRPRACRSTTTATVEGLTQRDGVPTARSRRSAPSVEGAGRPRRRAVTPIGRPAAPGKPTVEALDRAVRIGVTPPERRACRGYRYECSNDGGTTWPRAGDVGSAGTTLADRRPHQRRRLRLPGVRRESRPGLSEASPVSDAVMPCGSILECNPLLQPILAVLGVVLAGGFLSRALRALPRAAPRVRRGVVDVVHTANLGHGKRLGIAFVRAPDKRVDRDRRRHEPEAGRPDPPAPRQPVRGDRPVGPPGRDVGRAGRRGRLDRWAARPCPAGVRDEHGVGSREPLTDYPRPARGRPPRSPVT